ncbi:3774_t:CDS:2 [Gigaspora margarita]|uniref:3774_t:CDS:1 n=1 Tax=Gigaspora margarita TaxID=4874 RepID=A0ABN7VR52_GIGMA|nr:3774_t:CDS:2 [Gigaspora margarita]
MTINAQENPLAKLWGIEINELRDYIDRELNLIEANNVVIKYLNESSFAQTYINIKNNTLIVYTVDMSKVHEILSIPEVKPYEQFLDFKKVNNSLAYLKSSFNEIKNLAKQKKPIAIMSGIFPKLNNILIIVDYLERDANETEVLQEFLRSVSQYNPEIFFVEPPDSSHTKRSFNKRTISLMFFCGQCIQNNLYDANTPVGPVGFIVPLEIMLNEANLNLLLVQ